ncbi:hypothetical protein Taro_027906 [Colocasia esculenta]|uniref:Uncharacterized protein n=1 Tax=Colocasia esculenta TaxID=4460 RepID=A0A843VFT1_COLES|nr:hypothetical protein [Colocasia esculenta]
MSLHLVGVVWRSSWWLGEQEIAHTKPFFFPVASATTCIDSHLEVEQSKRSPTSGLNAGFLEQWDFFDPEGDYDVQEEEQVEDGNASE